MTTINHYKSNLRDVVFNLFEIGFETVEVRRSAFTEYQSELLEKLSIYACFLEKMHFLKTPLGPFWGPWPRHGNKKHDQLDTYLKTKTDIQYVDKFSILGLQSTGN